MAYNTREKTTRDENLDHRTADLIDHCPHLTPATEVKLENLLRAKDEQLPVPTVAQVIKMNEPREYPDDILAVLAIDPAWGGETDVEEPVEEEPVEEPTEPTGNWETGPMPAELSAIEQEGA